MIFKIQKDFLKITNKNYLKLLKKLMNGCIKVKN